ANFATAPGTAFVYSGFNYATLGRIITNVAGIPFSEFITKELLEPLKMTSTTWKTPNEFAPPHRLRDGDAIPDEPAPIDGDGGFCSAAGLWSTTEDILSWAKFMLDAFPARDDVDNGPLRRSSRREMQQVSRATGNVGGYGMGLIVRHDEAFGRIVEHT